MSTFVVDASATLPWCFEDESTPWTDGLLDRLRLGDRMAVPAHWPTEVSNGLLMAFRRKRILPGRAELFWDELSILPIDVEPPIGSAEAKTILALCELRGLTVYDAAYLELAKRKGWLLATLDEALIQAARGEGVVLVPKS
jgi:predicted nucleic acid-binding protein